MVAIEEPDTVRGQGPGVGSYGEPGLVGEKFLKLVPIEEPGTGWGEGPGVGNHRRARHGEKALGFGRYRRARQWLGRRPWGW